MSLPVTANTQAVAHANPNARPQANAPAKAARDYLTSNPGTTAAGDPFGKLVAQFAKDETPGF
jgi:hypothetical protein